VSKHWFFPGLPLLSSFFAFLTLLVSPSAIAAEDARLEEISITPSGFFLRLQGQASDVDQDDDDRRFTVELEDTQLSDQIRQREFAINRYGVTQLRIEQDGSNVKIELDLADKDRPWNALVTNQGITLVPEAGAGTLPAAQRITQILTRPAPVVPPAPPRVTSPPSAPRPPVTSPPPIAPEATPLPNVADQQVVIVIDPGHGGRDPGAVGIGGLREVDVLMPISLRVARILQEQGAQVILTRSDDRDLDLSPRVAIANRANADWFVSIHANAISMSRPDVNGVETYYVSPAGRALAESIQQSMLDATGMRNRGVKRANFYVLRNTSMPSVLVEVGFVTGEDDAPRLSDPAFLEVMADAIARGILEHVAE
jgi:N-acetylmuramoyl-L-alanine amidase